MKKTQYSNCKSKEKEKKKQKYELIEIYGEFKDGDSLDGIVAAVGQYDSSFNDDHIFYWFDDYDKIIGEHEDFIVRKYIDSKGLEHPKPKKKVIIRYLKSGAITVFIPESLTPKKELKYCEDLLNVMPDNTLTEGLKERENGFFDETPEIEAIEDVKNDYIETYSTSTWDEYTRKPKRTFNVLNLSVSEIRNDTKELLLNYNADWIPTNFKNGLFSKKETLLQFLERNYFNKKDKPKDECLNEIRHIISDLEKNKAIILYLHN